MNRIANPFSSRQGHQCLASSSVTDLCMTAELLSALGGKVSAEIVKGAHLKSYPGHPHGMPTTHADLINADLLAFI